MWVAWNLVFVHSHLPLLFWYQTMLIQWLFLRWMNIPPCFPDILIAKTKKSRVEIIHLSTSRRITARIVHLTQHTSFMWQTPYCDSFRWCTTTFRALVSQTWEVPYVFFCKLGFLFQKTQKSRLKKEKSIYLQMYTRFV